MDMNRSAEEYFNHIRVGKLPIDVTEKEIGTLFQSFGVIIRFFLKRRQSKESSIYLANPYVIIVFGKPDSVHQVMAARPFYIRDCLLFVRRCLPITRRYPYEAFITVRKILIRTNAAANDDILPDDHSIVEYLKDTGGKIEFYEKLDEKTVLVQFDDYDPADVCCLSRPHYINNQLIEIEKCIDEDQARTQAELRQTSIPISAELSPMNTVSPTPTPDLSVDDQIEQLRLTYNDITSRFEYDHEKLINSLSSEWKQIAKERIRFQRLTLDYQQEHERFTKEYRRWQKLFSESLLEKPNVQSEGEFKLQEASQMNAIAKENYDKLI